MRSIKRQLKQSVGFCSFDGCWRRAVVAGGVCLCCYEEIKPTLLELAGVLDVSLPELAQITLKALKKE